LASNFQDTNSAALAGKAASNNPNILGKSQFSFTIVYS
jgi:hypothetical protein